VRFSADRVQQGRDLANKMWNASRLILLNAEATPEARPVALEDRWILTRLQQVISSVNASIDAYDFSHAMLDYYTFFWSEFCDWYLEIVKPRLYDGDEDAAANLLFVLERVLGLAHPAMPFVTEEIWSYLPDRERMLLISEFPREDPTLSDTTTALAVEIEIERVRGVRRWRDLVGVPAGAVLEARIPDQTPEFVARLARLVPVQTSGEPLATIESIEILGSDQVDAEEAAQRIEVERERLRSEVERAERKLGNDGFVAKAPDDVVAAEREKLDTYRRELEELGA
jgi:valyl-tRNA synthetase